MHLFPRCLPFVLMVPLRLYKSLGDWDSVRGIFGGEVGTKPLTQKALDAEARGDYSQAYQVYNEVSRSHLRIVVV